MLDLELIARRGGTPEDMKHLFTATAPGSKIEELTSLHENRIRMGVDRNLEETPFWGAIDNALDCGKENLNYIQARELAQGGKTTEEIQRWFQKFKLDNLIEEAIDPTTGSVITDPKTHKPLYALNMPMFEQVIVPLVAAYCDIRVAKLVNDRDIFPRYKYSPPTLTLKDQLKTEALTSRVQRMTQDMGYASDDEQSIRQMIHYGLCFNFPKEPYYRETYLADDGDKVVSRTQREGVRFVIPHPRRHFYDRTSPLYTFNTDTGVRWAGYWDIWRYGDIQRSKQLWNKDSITFGGYSLFREDNWKFCSKFYPCVIKFPSALRDSMNQSKHDRIAGELDWNSQEDYDSSVIMAVLYDKLNPKEWGLFDYDSELWMRFIYGNLGTCVHAQVVPYTPGYVYLDKHDANKSVNDSMALKLVPFQQLLGNFLTQHFASVKQNLTRINFYNSDSIPKEQIDFLGKLKDRLYQKMWFLPFSQKKLAVLNASQQQIHSMMLQPVNTQEMQQNITILLSLLERTLGFSAQEVGAAASHEQSAHEVNIVNANVSVSLEASNKGINAAHAAKKRLLYNALHAYGDDDIFAEVTDLTPERRQALEELGFTIDDGAREGDEKFGVRGKKKALVMSHFVMEREGVNRLNDSKLGIAMLQSLGQVLQNQAIFERMGVDQVVQLINYIWKMIGLPDDFRIELRQGQDQMPQQEQLLQILQAVKEEAVKSAVSIVEQQTKQQVVEPIAKELSAVAQQLNNLKQQDGSQNEAIKAIIQRINTIQSAASLNAPVIQR